MFESARIKITLWYVLIIMIISGLFSVAVYQNLTNELARGFRAMRRIQGQLVPLYDAADGTYHIESDQELFDEARRRIALELLMTNLIILVLSGGASYLLAGMTLQPIERMMEDQKQFVSDASHELRTPLTAMKTEIEVTLRDKKITLAEAREMLKSNLEEVDKMQSLSNYLLSLTRYQNKQLPITMGTVQLDRVIEKAITQLKLVAANKKIMITTHLKAITITGNEMSLRELMVIFLDNAIKYSHDGTEVVVNTFLDRKQAVVEISDQGVGIPAKDLPHIFDRFYRAESSRSKITTNGYGLGLAIAKSIIELHKGRVQVKSEEEKGTTFRIILPIR